MPIYEYRCSSCDNHFEVLTSFGASVCCSRCGSAEVNKVFSSFASLSGSSSGEIPSSSGGSKCSGCSSSSCPPGCK